MSDRNSKLLARFQVYLEKEEKSDVQEQVQETKIAQTAFWSEMRNILAVNAGSSGLDVLDEVAKALIEETGLTAQAQSGPMRPAADKSAKGSSSKKQRTTSSPASSPAALGTPLITFPLATGLPKEFVRDLENIYRHVVAVKL
ncbi:hypothetical protein PF005_g5541 [Phytophthora fragariae]|uniref:Uncharacterized protein n=1 Tax=Phytophthora fragariae TaxID=53985 RepID=A0A6A3YW77_9STRA|nr:hypothetical protein PF005_g5541 [Phytophthora fragariae]KAE9240028.1 hypothetical protein PF004_g7682 [Phytophthora fragariae]